MVGSEGLTFVDTPAVSFAVGTVAASESAAGSIHRKDRLKRSFRTEQSSFNFMNIFHLNVRLATNNIIH